jgi:hypothetical protein
MSAEALREPLEAVYTAIRSSFDEPKPDTYLSLLDAAEVSAEMRAKLETNWSNSEMKQSLKEMLFPDLAQTRFVDVRTEGEFAGYYFLSDPQDPAFLTIEIIRFHRVGGAWKMRQARGSVTIPPGAHPEESQQKILHEIETDEGLRIIPTAGK